MSVFVSSVRLFLCLSKCYLFTVDNITSQKGVYLHLKQGKTAIFGVSHPTKLSTPKNQLFTASNPKILILIDTSSVKISKTVSGKQPSEEGFPNEQIRSFIYIKEENPAKTRFRRALCWELKKIKKIFQKPIDNCLNVCYNSVNDKPIAVMYP